MAASDTRSCTMAAEAAVQIMLQKLDILLSHRVCVECLSMQTRAKDAKAKLARIQEFLSTQYRPSETTAWLGRLLRAMYYAEELIDKFHLRESRKRHEALLMAVRPLATLVSKYKLWRELSILANKMEELCDEKFLMEEVEGKKKKEPAGSSSHASAPWQGKKFARLTRFWDRQVPTNFLCHKAKKEEIMEQIKEKKGYKETSIWGEQGTGKTFLARWFYSQGRYMGYEWRAWVHVSACVDEQEFLFEILKQVDNLAWDVKDMNIQKIRSALRKKMEEKRKFLIVLDDVSNMQFFGMLWWDAIFCSEGHIIITTKDAMIARFTNGVGKIIQLDKLSDEGSQSMLAWKLHRVPDAQRLSREEKDILKMCPGLPLCISLLSGLLSNAGEHERAVLAEEVSKMTLLDILQLSYHKLPVHLKPCFIYMALFPIALPIPTRRLVRLWLAEGLLYSHCYNRDRERTRSRPPEDVGEMFILELADRNVIDVVSWRADGSPKACQMLTSLYDMIRPIMMSSRFLHIHATSKLGDKNDRDPTSQQQQLPAQLRERTKIRWLAEYTNIVIDDHGGSYTDLNLGHVRSFLSFYLRRGMLTKDISTFLRQMTSKTDYNLLRVLDLEGVYKPSLDGVLHKLVLLRYLGLRSTVLDSLPSAVADLHHLETLDIKHTNITLLPSSFWKARNLRHLHLNWFYINLKNIFKTCSNNVNALAQLQTLSELVISEAKENLMMDHMDSLTTLTTLKFFLQCSSGDTSGAVGKAVADWISFKLTNLQSLTFGVIQEDKPTKEEKPKKEAKPMEGAKPTKEKPATWPIGLLPKLSLAEQHHDLLELYLLGQLIKPIWTQLLPVSLRVLTLSGSKVEADMMLQLGNILKHLRTLRLLANSFLGTSLTFVKDGFPSLKILKIWKLPQLVKVIIEPGAMLHLNVLEFRHVKSLETVEGIKECKELENICVKFQSDALVKQLESQVEGKNVHVEIDAKRRGSTDNDEDDSDDDNEATNSP